MLAVVSAAIAPGIALMSYIYLKDKYESEPIGVVIKCFILGALLVIPVMVLQYAFQTENVWQSRLLSAFILNGWMEEFFKWFVVIYTAYHHVAFTERYDGIVYATSVSLGFASAENLFYLYAYGIHYALWRALLPVSSHGLFGILMGYYIGKAKYAKHKRYYLFFALLLAALLHGVYDWLMSAESKWLYLIVPFMFVLWWDALRKIKKLNRNPDPWIANRNPNVID